MAHRITFSPLFVIAKNKFKTTPGGTIVLASPHAVQTGVDTKGEPIFDVVPPDERDPDDSPYGRTTITVDNDDAFNAATIGEVATAEFTFLGTLPEPTAEERKAIVRPSKAALAAAMGIPLHDDTVAADVAAEMTAETPAMTAVRTQAPR